MSNTKEVSMKEIIENAPVNENGKKTKTPRNYDSILKGALALSLADRVELKKTLHDSITLEVATKKREADEAAKLAGE